MFRARLQAARSCRRDGDDTCSPPVSVSLSRSLSLSLSLSLDIGNIIGAIAEPRQLRSRDRGSPGSRERENRVAHGCTVATLRQFSPHPSTYFPNANVNYFLEKSRYVKKKKKKKHTYAKARIDFHKSFNWISREQKFISEGNGILVGIKNLLSTHHHA